jgi:hypothetical protein
MHFLALFGDLLPDLPYQTCNAESVNLIVRLYIGRRSEFFMPDHAKNA